ncbi:MAG: hypothetical protein WD066_09795 [Planctomycetaceae bacterium]
MHSITRFAAAVFVTLSSLALSGTAFAEESDGDVVTKQVKVRDVTLTLPDSWRQTQPASTLRLAQFEVPPVMGDKEPTELAVFSFAGGGGGVDDNIRRWISQFEGQGREVTLTKGKSPQGEYWFADIQGTYLMPVGPPIRQQTKRLEGGRMLGIILKADKGVYFLRMAGPRYTVSAQENAIRKAIGAAQGEETEHELAEEKVEP